MTQLTSTNARQGVNGAGVLYLAPLGTAEPSSPSAAFPSAWFEVGPTREGHTDTVERTSTDILAAELDDPFMIIDTAQTATIAFTALQMSVRNIVAAYNARIVSQDASYAKLGPRALGDNIEYMVGWDSFDNGVPGSDQPERKIWRRCRQTGSTSISRSRTDVASLPFNYRVLAPSGGADSYSWWVGGQLIA